MQCKLYYLPVHFKKVVTRGRCGHFSNNFSRPKSYAAAVSYLFLTSALFPALAMPRSSS